MLPSDFFYPSPIEPMPALAALRDAILQRSHKRMPRWRFRIAPDIVTQIQPKLAKRTRKNCDGLPWFDCRAVVHPEANAAMLTNPGRAIAGELTSGCRSTARRGTSRLPVSATTAITRTRTPYSLGIDFLSPCRSHSLNCTRRLC